jgi:hypothetical protein
VKKTLGIIISGICLMASALWASEAVDYSQAVVLGVDGEAKYLKKDSQVWQVLQIDNSLTEGDTVKTSPGSQVSLLMMGQNKTAELTVRENTTFKFETFRHEDAKENTMLDVQLGGVLVKAEKLVGDSKFEVKTPTSIVGIRGTTFEVNVADT